MMMNRIGKGLVLVNTAASLVALAWAAGVFFQFTDWGWKEPRSELGLRIPSEYDKRTATFKEAVKARDMALPALQPAWASLREAEERFPQNHLFYNQELARLRSSTEPIEVKYVSNKAGPIVLDTPGKAIGKPNLSYTQFAPGQIRPALLQSGMSSSMADLLLEMSEALNSGYMAPLEPRSAQNTTPTPIETFVAEEFLPRFTGKAAAHR